MKNNLISAERKNDLLNKFASVIFIALTIIYAGYINFNIGFTNGDEIGFAASYTSDLRYIIKSVIESGRISQLISLPLSIIFVPNEIELINLIPRYITILFYFITIYYLLHLHTNMLFASIFSFVTITFSQLDYDGVHLMFNGLIAYGGVFSLFFCFFIWSTIANEYRVESKKLSIIRYVVVYLLCLASFGTEAMVVAAVIYFISGLIFAENKIKYMITSPFLMAISSYIMALLIANLLTQAPAADEMKQYLAGSLYSHNIIDVIKAGIIHLIYSIPLYNKLGFENEITFAIGISIFIIFILLLFKSIVHQKALNSKEMQYGLISSRLLFSLIGFTLAANTLLALRPDRLERALTLEWTRYIYTPYTLFVFIYVIIYAFNILKASYFDRKNNTLFSFVVSVVVLMASIPFLRHNLSIISDDRNNIGVWYEINKNIINGEGKSIKVNEESMMPSRLVGWEHGAGTYVLANKYFNALYGRDIFVCNTNLLHQPGVSISREGRRGGWTVGGELKIQLPKFLARDDMIYFYIDDILGQENMINPAVIRFNDDESTDTFLVISPKTTAKININTDWPRKLTVYIPNPISPKSLNMSPDERLLGYWINDMEIFQLNSSGEYRKANICM